MSASGEAPAAVAAEPSDDGHDGPPAGPLAAGLWGIALLSVLFAWWTWQEGAYFGSTLLAGLIALCAAVLILARVAPWRLDLGRSPAAAVALGALVLLACWSVISAFWSPTPDTAVADGQRIFTYALCFGCGLWFCSMLGRRIELALLPLTAAAAFGGGAAVVALLTGDDPRSLLEEDGTLFYPLGYRNANAAFFAVALFPAIGLAADRALDWRARGLALGTATLCLSLFLFTQSRASLPALVIGVAIFLLASPLRLRSAIWLLLAVAGGLAILPARLGRGAARPGRRRAARSGPGGRPGDAGERGGRNAGGKVRTSVARDRRRWGYARQSCGGRGNGDRRRDRDRDLRREGGRPD